MHVYGRQACWVWTEERTQGGQVRQFTGIERSAEFLGQFTLAAAIMSQRQQFDRDLAGLSVGQFIDEHVEGPAIFLPRETLVPVDEMEERHRLLAQGMNDVPIIDDLIVPSIGMAAPTRQGHQMRPADEDLETIVEETTRTLWPIKRDGTV